MKSLPIPNLRRASARFKIIARFGVWLGLFCVGSTSGLAQGSLTPPGAPAPTMKSLAQIEPRTDVSTLPGGAGFLHHITTSGSYYLTTNLTGVAALSGINIATNNVTLDLNGFTLQGVAGSVNGISVQGATTNITICNGAVSGWGSYGVSALNASSRNLVFEQLNVSASGQSGLFVYYSQVNRCNISTSGGYGIYAYYSEVRDCTVRSNSASGIYADHSLVRGGHVDGNRDNGFYVITSTVSDCLVQNNSRSGIYVDGPGCVITENNCRGNNTGNYASNAGIYIRDSRNRVDGNHVIASGVSGIQVEAAYVNNVVIRNTVDGNGASNFVNPGGNDFGPVGVAATATSPWANISH